MTAERVQPNWFEGVEETFRRNTAGIAGQPGLRALQVGAYVGDASVWLLQNVLTGQGASLIDVDTWEGSADESPHAELDWSEVERFYRSRTYGLPVTPTRMTSRQFFDSYAGEPFDFIYIDGSHQAAEVMADARAADRVLKVGGLLAFDDYLWSRPDKPTDIPKVAIDEFLDEHGHRYELLERGYQVWLRKRRDYGDVKIAVYSVALNEAANVNEWATSAAWADQILLADTGSTDDTFAIAQSNPTVTAVQIAVRPFRFDDARNAALAAVDDDIDICISLDLDERLEPGWRKELEEAWRDGGRRFTFMLQYSPNVLMRHDKIHARHQFRWVCPAHETLVWTGSPVGGGPRSRATGLRMVQHQEPGKESRGGYLKLLQMGHAERPHDPRMVYYLAREYFFYGPWEPARELIQKYLRMPEATYDQERSEACRLMAKMVYPEHKEQWLMRATWEAPARREPWVDLAEFYAEDGHLDGVRYALSRVRTQPQTDNNSFFLEARAWSEEFLDSLILKAESNQGKST